jgi:Aldo/keto reductase family
VDDDAIRALLTRLARAHPSGGTVVERAAILAEGADFDAVIAWVRAHGGQPEARTRYPSPGPVSKLCLGTMMFGARGNTDHDDSIRIIDRALDAGVNFVDSADIYSAGESEEIVRQGAQGPPRRHRPGHEVLHADGRPRTGAAGRDAGSFEPSRTRCAGSAPTTSTSTRSTDHRRTSTSRRRSPR